MLPIFLATKDKYNILIMLKDNLDTGKIDMNTFNAGIEILFSSKEEMNRVCKIEGGIL